MNSIDLSFIEDDLDRTMYEHALNAINRKNLWDELHMFVSNKETLSYKLLKEPLIRQVTDAVYDEYDNHTGSTMMVVLSFILSLAKEKSVEPFKSRYLQRHMR